ncbi:MAG: exodeoxyribonuclease III [Oscillospiraceae bacterium]
MKFISWNVNGLRACMNKGFEDFFREIDADIFSVQETKMQREQANFEFDGYEEFWNSAVKKGYSGTACFTKQEPLAVTYDIGDENHVGEGRVITLEYEKFYLVNCYTPNAQRGLARIDYRMSWEDAFRKYLLSLDEKKPVIVCGDLNVAHNEIDLKNAKSNVGNAGFSNEERGKFGELLASGFTDTFRKLYPDKIQYSWWSYMFNARANNAGWRIDYFLCSDRIADKVKDSVIYTDIMGSDHCPVGIEIDL